MSLIAISSVLCDRQAYNRMLNTHDACHYGYSLLLVKNSLKIG